jgi:hypothetical protein
MRMTVTTNTITADTDISTRRALVSMPMGTFPCPDPFPGP